MIGTTTHRRAAAAAEQQETGGEGVGGIFFAEGRVRGLERRVIFLFDNKFLVVCCTWQWHCLQQSLASPTVFECALVASFPKPCTCWFVTELLFTGIVKKLKKK